MNKEVELALTTQGYPSDKNNSVLAQQGHIILKDTLYDCFKVAGVKEQKLFCLVADAISSEVLAQAFDAFAGRHTLPVRMGVGERAAGMSKKTKAAILKALFYVLESTDEFFIDLLEEILRHAPVEHFFGEVNKIIQVDSCQTKTVNDCIVYKRVGGTDNFPVWHGVLSYTTASGVIITVEAENIGSRKELRRILCQKWLSQYRIKIKAAQ